MDEVAAKASEAERQGCSTMVYPKGNEGDWGLEELTISMRPVHDINGLLREGFHNTPISFPGDGLLPLDDGAMLGRAVTYNLLYDELDNHYSIIGILMPIDCAIYPGIGDVIVTGLVSMLWPSSSLSPNL